MRILELGSYIVPAYAGMVLAEQGHAVEKWTNGRDPILGLDRGEELWAWINHGKRLVRRDLADVAGALASGEYDAVIDNVRPSTWKRLGVEPAVLALLHDVRWISMEGETGGDTGEVSFDVFCQARVTMEFAGWIPFYIGDTGGGLWVAFKLLAAPGPGHYMLGHASCLQKLVEGELVVDTDRTRTGTPWDREPYGADENGALVSFKGAEYREPIRDRAWKIKHLRHRNGRIVI
ncbi:hypothetical protein GCM10007036_14200 [Alsobacter metallidurans]|uniref:Uncharacterized protein n=1 Tax=Alsobacter metallidurans TaxID=340221 RepID=A0A917I4S7_9HYPH|nr:CoA transferase [Alsobacter metallidurans]GGH14688.1 hypothetical protein GCM10007036_14200 [Alsobacter metallidurans]